MKPIQNQYRDLLEGKMSKHNFLTNVKRTLSDYVSNVTSFDDAVKILKNKRILSEIKEDTDQEDTKAEEMMDFLYEDPQFDFHKAAIESASGDKVEKREEDDEGQPLYFSLNSDYVNYYIGSGNKIIKYDAETGERYSIGDLKDYEDHTTDIGYADDYDEFQQDRERHLPESLNEDWGSSDQATFNRAIHKDLGEPKKMPMPFDPRLEAAVESAVDFWWDEWDEYVEDRDGLINHAKRLYYRSYFPKDFEMLTQMFSENKEEDDAIIATYEDEQDAKHTLPGGHLREDVEIDPITSAKLDRVNPLEYNTGLDYELDLSNDFSAEGLQKAIKKVLKNLDKDQIYYTNLKASLTQKINKKQIDATELVQVKKDNQVDDLNQLKTLVKNHLANTKTTLGKKEKATSATPKGVKLMKEAEEEKFDLNKYNKNLFKKQSKEFTDKLTKPVTQKNTLKDKIKDYVAKQLKKEAVKFTIGQTGQEHEYKNAKDAPEFEKDLKASGVKFTKTSV
jgi:hypothetical protein